MAEVSDRDRPRSASRSRVVRPSLLPASHAVSRTIYSTSDRDYVALPYDSFRAFGAPAEPERPVVAVPFAERIDDALIEPLELARRLRRNFGELEPGDTIPRAREDRGKWTLDRLKHSPWLLFRGESVERNGILPSLVRLLHLHPEGDRIDVVDSRGRLADRATRLMSKAHRADTGQELTETQGKALARQYGAPSSLLDFSFDPQVAAFFGHPPFTKDERRLSDERRLGILYCLDFSLLNHVFPMSVWQIENDTVSIHLLQFSASVEIPYLSLDEELGLVTQRMLRLQLPRYLGMPVATLRGTPVAGVRRIAAQQGVFLEGATGGSGTEFINRSLFVWCLLDFLCHKWCYRRRDYQYNDPAAGITAESLLPADGRNVRRAARVVRRWSY